MLARALVLAAVTALPAVALAQTPRKTPAPAPAPQPAPAPAPAAGAPDPNAPPPNPYGQPNGQAPAGQAPAGQYPNGQYPNGQYPPPAYPNGQYPAGQYPNGQYPAGQYPSGQYPAGQYPAGQYPSSGYASMQPIGPQPQPGGGGEVITEYHGQPAGQAEMIVDFGAVGLMTGITIDLRGVNNGSLGTLVIVGSTAGGGALGWLLADRSDATRGDAYLTTLGLTVGAANGALLLSPTHNTDNAEQVMGVLTLSSAVGTLAGFAASRGERLTPGQSMFATNITFMGVGSAALIASITDGDGHHDNSALTALAVGLDGGALVGLAVAPRVEWSNRRAQVVAMGSLVGTLVGGMAAGLVAPKTANEDGTSSLSQNFVATSLLIGAWAGFGAGIYMTRDMAPDPKYDPRFQKTASRDNPVTVMPMIRGDGAGIAMGGTF